MFRFLTLAALLAGALLLTQGVAQAQDSDLPVAAADEIIFVGEAPAPPGTEITANYVSLTGEGAIVCGSTSLDSRSRFTLVIDATCAEGAVGPLVCWGNLRSGRCQSFSPPLTDSIMPVTSRTGQTIDAGRLVAEEPISVADWPIPPGSTGPQAILPAAGGADSPASLFDAAALWTGAALLAMALLAGAGSLMFRRRG